MIIFNSETFQKVRKHIQNESEHPLHLSFISTYEYTSVVIWLLLYGFGSPVKINRYIYKILMATYIIFAEGEKYGLIYN